MTENKRHCTCCICIRNDEYKNLLSGETQMEFLNKLITVERLRVIVYDASFEHINDLLDTTKVLDMKKLLHFIQASFELQDCDALHYFPDVSDKHLTELCNMYSQYVMFQINMLTETELSASIEEDEVKEKNLQVLSYMFQDNIKFILDVILQTDEDKRKYVNVLIT